MRFQIWIQTLQSPSEKGKFLNWVSRFGKDCTLLEVLLCYFQSAFLSAVTEPNLILSYSEFQVHIDFLPWVSKKFIAVKCCYDNNTLSCAILTVLGSIASQIHWKYVSNPIYHTILLLERFSTILSDLITFFLRDVVLSQSASFLMHPGVPDQANWGSSCLTKGLCRLECFVASFK